MHMRSRRKGISLTSGTKKGDIGTFIAANAQMREVRSRAELVATVDVPVLLLGETGTRVVAATNVEIGSAIIGKTFREDLYYRLSAFTLHLPPLRERKDKIPLLVRHLMERFSSQYALEARPLPPALMEAFLSYSWPGNIRELENLVRRYLVLGNEDMIRADGASRLGFGSQTPSPVTRLTGPSLAKCGLKSLVRGARREVETEAIVGALERTNWNRTLAARMLKISYRSLRHKMAQYDIVRRQATGPHLPENCADAVDGTARSAQDTATLGQGSAQ
jgi:DNA-binding NtrC family response regulator